MTHLAFLPLSVGNESGCMSYSQCWLLGDMKNDASFFFFADLSGSSFSVDTGMFYKLVIQMQKIMNKVLLMLQLVPNCRIGRSAFDLICVLISVRLLQGSNPNGGRVEEVGPEHRPLVLFRPWHSDSSCSAPMTPQHSPHPPPSDPRCQSNTWVGAPMTGHSLPRAPFLPQLPQARYPLLWTSSGPVQPTTLSRIF